MAISKSDINRFAPGTAEYVVMHALWSANRGRNPSANFFWLSNPNKALAWAKSHAYFPDSGAYLEGRVPENYICGECGASGVKLWRENQTFQHQYLLCQPCACSEQCEIRTPTERDITDHIGWCVPAVPTEKNDTYWEYQFVPSAGADWWCNLPTIPADKTH